MKLRNTILMAAVALTAAISCKKEEASTDTVSATPQEITLLADGSSEVYVAVSASGYWQVLKAEGSGWISVIPADNDGGVVVSAGKNSSTIERSGTFAINCGTSSATVSVSQAGAEQDVITVDKDSLVFDASGAPAQNITVTASDDWTLTVSAGCSWIKAGTISGGKGQTAVSISAEVNEITEERSGSLTLSCGTAKAKVSVTQAAAEIPTKKIYVKFGSDAPIEIKEAGEGIYEGIVDRPATGNFSFIIEDETYGFLSHSGAGGLGEDCKDSNSGLPLEYLGSIPYKFVVNKATGSMDKSEAQCPFTLSYTEAGRMKVRIDAGKTVPTYYIENYVEDPSVVYDEQFDLLLGGGSYSTAIFTYTTPMKDGKGDAYGQWNTKVSKYTQPDFNMAVWAGDDATATKGLCKEFLEALGIAEWVGVDGSNFGCQFQALHIGSSNCSLAAVYSPKFKALTGNTDVTVTLDMFRFAAGTTADVVVEVVGGGQITEGKTTVDYIDWNDRTAKTQVWTVTAPVTQYTLKDNDYFSHTTTWNDSSASSANSKILKPISHMIFTVKDATPETGLYISSAANQRLQIHGLKVVKK